MMPHRYSDTERAAVYRVIAERQWPAPVQGERVGKLLWRKAQSVCDCPELWGLARAEGLGMGWMSRCDPQPLDEMLFENRWGQRAGA